MKYIYKLSVIFIFVLAPIADTFGGLTNDFLPTSLLVRLAILLTALPIIVNCRRTSKQLFPLIMIVFSYILTTTFIQLLISDSLEYSINAISNAIKLMYFPILLAVIIALYDKKIISKVTIKNGILLTGTLVIFSILLGKVSGFGAEIAGRGSDISGNKGFLIGANEVGLMLLLTAPTVIAWISSTKILNRFTNISALIIYSASGLIVFTKSSIASITIPIANWLLFSTKENHSKISRISAKCFLIIVTLTSLAMIYSEDIENTFGKTFFVSLLEGNIIDFVFRGRFDYFDAINPGLIDNSYNYLIVLFGAGEGYIRSLSITPLGRSMSEGTMFEMDALDLFWSYGFIGTTLYLTSIYYSIKFAKLSKPSTLNIFALAMALVHSILAGHVIFSPQISTLIAFIVMLNPKSSSGFQQPAAWTPRRLMIEGDQTR